MDAILRGATVYLFLLVVFRITGKRALAQVTSFDFVLLLIVAETTQQALLGNDFSVTNSALLIITLFTLDLAMSYVKEYSKKLDKLIDGVPLIILENGQPIRDRMKKARVDDTDILSAARELHGLERLDQIKYAVLERSGGISIIPKRGE